LNTLSLQVVQAVVAVLIQATIVQAVVAVRVVLELTPQR
jgi:hypothetical protein